MINLVEVDKESFWKVIKLSVGKNQKSFIESNKQSIAESKYYEYWKPTCIYIDEDLIGFTMYGKVASEENRVWLDRYMIDQRYQGKGYGSRVLNYIILYLKKLYNCNEIYISIFEDNIHALHMYQKVGFEFNGELDYGGEKVMVKTLEN
ncbi:MAG: GNAT family N-acetyltransferase [Sarcina sp.]